jgi:biopolymer transport protein ExbB
MSKKNEQGQSLGEALKSAFTIIAIILAFIVSLLIYKFIMGNPANFEGGNPAGHPLPGNYLAMIYKGGMIVPLLMTCVLTILIFWVERLIMLSIAKGGNHILYAIFWLIFIFIAALPSIIYFIATIKARKSKGNLTNFIKNVQQYINRGEFDEAIILCDKFKGSIANVIRSGLVKIKELNSDSILEKEQKILALQKEIEEATALELPMLSRNLVIFSTLASISVLIGLIGTVLGMIRAFAALATAGSPDALALATGISEALINTAFGITGSTVSIILYNYFSTRIDSLTFKMDEAGFSLVQMFATTTK